MVITGCGKKKRFFFDFVLLVEVISKKFEIIILIAENQIILLQHIAFPFYKTPFMLHSSQLVSVAPLSLGV